MEIQTLPYVAPQPGLTANTAPQNLKDHYLAFVAHYNGLIDAGEDAVNSSVNHISQITFDTPLVDILVFLSQQEFLTDKEMDKIVMFVRIQIKKADATDSIKRQARQKLIHAAMGWHMGGCYHKHGRWLRNPQVGKLQKRKSIFTG